MTKISSKCLYGLSALFELASHGKSLPVKQIAKAQGIPEDYLRQLLVSLKRAGFIQSTRGNVGGYALARPASEISVKDIIEHLDGPFELPTVPFQDPTLKAYLSERQQVMATIFDQTLESLVAERKRAETTIIYQI